MQAVHVRRATEADLEAINAIYNREVLEGIATWELEPWSASRRVEWFRARDDQEPVFVAERAGAVIGFGYLTKYRGRAGYRFTREDTVFVHPDHQRQGVGRAILTTLVDEARRLDLHTLLAFIDAENAGSLLLHRAFGFRAAGFEVETGHKFGRWRSSVELQFLLTGDV